MSWSGLRCLGGALLLLLLATGCCINQVCECPGQSQADTIYLRFVLGDDSNTNTGFTPAELDTVWVVRVALDTLIRPARDSVKVSTLPATEYVLRLNQNGPFSSNTVKANRYLYLIRGYEGHPFDEHRLTDIALSGHYSTVSACCTCYENLQKEARLDGGPLLDLRERGGQPVYIELRK